MIHIKNEQQKVSNWSGGTTREIYIYPEGSDYSSRQFDFRLSSATVECETSTFTPLPGIHRHLMILDGTLVIDHKGHYQKKLHPFDQDEFEGDWETSSEGKVVDFNLMLKKGTGEIHPYPSSAPFGQGSGDLFFLYLHSGELEYQGRRIAAGDFLLWESMPDLSAKNLEGVATGVSGKISL